MVKNLLSNAGYKDLIPGQRTKIPHAMGQLRLYTATREKFPPRCNYRKPVRSYRNLAEPKMSKIKTNIMRRCFVKKKKILGVL